MGGACCHLFSDSLEEIFMYKLFLIVKNIAKNNLLPHN